MACFGKLLLYAVIYKKKWHQLYFQSYLPRLYVLCERTLRPYDSSHKQVFLLVAVAFNRIPHVKWSIWRWKEQIKRIRFWCEIIFAKGLLYVPIQWFSMDEHVRAMYDVMCHVTVSCLMLKSRAWPFQLQRDQKISGVPISLTPFLSALRSAVCGNVSDYVCVFVHDTQTHGACRWRNKCWRFVSHSFALIVNLSCRMPNSSYCAFTM